MKTVFRKLLKDNRGTTVLEYGFICAGIVIGLVVAVKGVGDGNSGSWQAVFEKYTTAAQEADKR